jgi:sugar lactone lactonase YvrE
MLRRLCVAAGVCLLACGAGAVPADAALSPGQLVVVDGKAYGGCGGGCGGLISVDPTTGAEAELSANSMPINSGSQLFHAPFALAFDPSGEIIVISTSGLGGSCVGGCGGVLKVDPNTGQETLVSSNTMPVNASSQYFYQPTGVTVDSAGNIWVSDWGYCVGCGKVIKVDPATGKETLISSNSLPVNASSQLFDYVQGLALDRSGHILVANASTHSGVAGNLLEVDPVTGKETELSGNDMPVNASSQYLWAPVNLALDAAGNILVADWGHHPGGTGDIVKVDPGTGKEALLSANSLPVNAASQYFDGPVGITLDGQGDILVADESAFGPCSSTSCGGVVKVDPATGKETMVSANDIPVNSSHQLFVQPFEIAVVPTPGSGGSGGGGTSGGGTGGGSGGGSGPGAGGGSPPPSGGSTTPHLATTIVRSRIRSRHHSATFRFRATSVAGGVAFYCQLDRRRISRCRSPMTYRHLRRGRHRFAVYAVALRNRKLRSPPVVRKFSINR